MSDFNPETNLPYLPEGYRWEITEVRHHPEYLRVDLQKKGWLLWSSVDDRWVGPFNSPRDTVVVVLNTQQTALELKERVFRPPAPDLSSFTGIFPPNKLGD